MVEEEFEDDFEEDSEGAAVKAEELVPGLWCNIFNEYSKIIEVKNN